MLHLPPLIIDLALILGAAGITTLLFKRLKQPVVLGYILSGLLVGPNFTLFPTVTDAEGIRTWADIGVIFLLFALGLEFSFKKLSKVGASAGITGTIEISAMLFIGFSAGRWLQWPLIDSLFLGGILAISSTTIIFRAFDELGLRTRQSTNLVLGVLIIEDLIAIVLMVLLSSLSVSRQVEGGDMLLAIGKLLFFLILWFLIGIFLVPSVLKKSTRWLNNETLLILAIALCLGMVVFAESVGFSAALGAFVMGSILSESIHSERIEHLMTPVKNLFGAIFFVSVGMLIDPAMLLQYARPVLLLTVLVIGGKFLFVTTGALLAGTPLRQSIETGTSMTQIGEFSFIIATLGVSLGVTSNYLYPIAVGVSVFTTFTTPYVIMAAAPFTNWLEKRMPTRWQKAITLYSAGTQVLKGESDWRIVLKLYLQLLVVNGVILLAILLLSQYFLQPAITELVGHARFTTVISTTISLLAMMPFIWALAAKKFQHRAYRALWLDAKYNHGPLVAMEAIRIMAAILFVGALFIGHFSWPIATVLTMAVLVIVLFIFKNRLQQFYHRLEYRFLDNLHEKERVSKHNEVLAPWDAHLSKFQLGPNSVMVGQTLEQLALRENFGINIAYVERGSQLLYAPSRHQVLYPFDEIGAIGTDAQLQKFAQLLEAEAETASEVALLAKQIKLDKIIVDAENGLAGKTISESKIREQSKGLIIGLERNSKRQLNPPSDTLLQWGDVLWIVGDRNSIDAL
jgi:CPA2 family monovalent cation:H+ antiporter-2